MESATAMESGLFCGGVKKTVMGYVDKKWPRCEKSFISCSLLFAGSLIIKI